MQTYIIELSVLTGFITPWHADTIFGHLCWVAERHNGFDNFNGAAEFIELYRKESPPLIISDAFPSGLLPAPVNLRDIFSFKDDSALTVEQYSFLKRVKNAEYITVEQFHNYQRGKPFDFGEKEMPYETSVTLHNQINRLSNTMGDQGSLFQLDEKYVKQGKLNIYVRIKDGFKNDVVRLFELFATGGFGKKKSTGKGTFKISRFEEFNLLDSVDNPNGFVCLSHFVPAHHDPVDGIYKTIVKYGKLGDEKSLQGNPFKKPLLMLKPGSIFKTETKPKDFYGCLINGIAPAKPEVVQYAYSFAAPTTCI